MFLPTLQAFGLSRSGEVRGCVQCNADVMACWPAAGSTAQSEPPPRGTSPTPSRAPATRGATNWRPEWAGLVEQAKAVRDEIKAGVASGDVIRPLRQAQQSLPPSVPRPVECLNLMVDALSKRRVDPAYSSALGDKAVACYEGQTMTAARPSSGSPQPSGQPQQHGPLWRFLVDLDRAIDDIPGLSKAIADGAALTGKMVEEIRNDYDLTRSPYAALRLIRDALIGEVGEGVKIAQRAVGDIAAEQIGRLVTKEASALERRLGGLVEQAERAEDEAVIKAIAQIEKRLQALSDLQKISNLKDQMRGANARINKIMYWLHEA
jgi:hypothetical protein